MAYGLCVYLDAVAIAVARNSMLDTLCFQDTHPVHAPICYVIPTADMQIKVRSIRSKFDCTNPEPASESTTTYNASRLQ
jgi:hypothetical protein